jgi:hypothetical protein
MTDPLVEVVARMYGDFADRATLAEVLAVVARCRNDLDTPSATALPEIVERLARQRLTDHLTSPATGNGSALEEHGVEPIGECGIICLG